MHESVGVESLIFEEILTKRMIRASEKIADRNLTRAQMVVVVMVVVVQGGGDGPLHFSSHS